MLKFKSHKTIEQIAKKHGVDASFIKKQLEIGHPIEHEHTKDSDLAMDIALQHLEEIPDYYTRLKKMEVNAKKKVSEGSLHKWFNSSKSKDGKPGWVNVVTGGTCASDEPGEGTPKCVSSAKRASMTKAERLSASRRKKEADPTQQQKTGSAKPTYVPTDKPKKKMNESKERDHEYSMARSELSTIINAAKRLQKKMGKGEGNIEAWVQSKITKAADYLDKAADYVDSGEHDVMDESCWNGYKQVGMKKKGKKLVPNCVPEEHVSEEDIKGKGSGEKDACYNKVKSRYKVWPSAYASGALVKCRKVGASNWGNKSEEISIEDAYGNKFAEIINLIEPEPIKGFASQVSEATRLQAQNGNVIAVTLSWRGKYYSLKMFFPQSKLPTRREINDELQKIYPGCSVVHQIVSEIQPGQPLIQAFGPQGGSSAKLGPNKNYVKPMGMFGEEIEMDEDWQKVNRQDKTDGLSQKAVNAYRKENPGSKLQTAVTEKNPTGKRAERRKSFCSRMKGMKKRLTSAETARDPDSRINKALRRWNCN
jgi:hypothetical protein